MKNYINWSRSTVRAAPDPSTRKIKKEVAGRNKREKRKCAKLSCFPNGSHYNLTATKEKLII